MALQDLTPQLRTRLSRLERLVGWFVAIAILLLLAGLGYYVYELAQRKGWFVTKMRYYTFVHNASGLTEGEGVQLMGFNVGQITKIEAQPPNAYFNVFIQFEIRDPYYGYLWDDSRARIGAADFLGHRYIEVTKGSNGVPTYAMNDVLEVSLAEARSLVGATNKYAFGEDVYEPNSTNLVVRFSERLTSEKLQRLAQLGIQQVTLIDFSSPTPVPPKWMWDEKQGKYVPIPKDSKGYWLVANESPALTERLETVVNTVEEGLPGFLALTNKLAAVLSNAEAIVTHADDLLVNAKPILTNFAQITAHLRNPQGSLGEWLLPTNLNQRLQTTLASASTTLNSAQTNLNTLTSNLVLSLQNLAGVTSNLNAQVQADGLILSELSDLVVHADEMVQGLKRFWLFRSVFAEATNKPPESVVHPRIGGEK